jgi:hypothetical protein
MLGKFRKTEHPATCGSEPVFFSPLAELSDAEFKNRFDRALNKPAAMNWGITSLWASITVTQQLKLRLLREITLLIRLQMTDCTTINAGLLALLLEIRAMPC